MNIEPVIDLIDALERTDSPAEAAERAVEAARAVTAADGGWVELVEDDEALRVAGAAGSAASLRDASPAWPGVRAGVEYGRPEVVGVGAGAGERATLALAGARELGGELLVAPLRGGGALVLHRAAGGDAFDADQVGAAELIAGALGLALRRMQGAAGSRRATEQMGRFVRAVSHDLKNPLGAVAGYVELLESGVRGELTPEQREWTERIRGVVQEMLALVGDLLDLARIETGALDIDTQTVPPGALLGEAVDLLRGAGAEAGVRLEEAVPGQLPAVVGDPGRILQVLEKLFALMLHSVEAGAVVRLEVETAEWRGGPATVLRLRGRAPGLVAALGGKTAFEGLLRVDSGADRPAITGLELVLSRRIARTFGGDVRVGGEGEEAVLELWVGARDRA